MNRRIPPACLAPSGQTSPPNCEGRCWLSQTDLLEQQQQQQQHQLLLKMYETPSCFALTAPWGRGQSFTSRAPSPLAALPQQRALSALLLGHRSGRHCESDGHVDPALATKACVLGLVSVDCGDYRPMCIHDTRGVEMRASRLSAVGRPHATE